MQPGVIRIGHEDVGALVHARADASVRKVPHPLLLGCAQGLCQFAHNRKADLTCKEEPGCSSIHEAAGVTFKTGQLLLLIVCQTMMLLCVKGT